MSHKKSNYTNGYYVYRFINDDGVIVYVGRTKNLRQRFLQHSHLTQDVSRIEYIECESEAEMVWKEIYYINLFYNDLSTNVSDVYSGGSIKDIGLLDKWKPYEHQVRYNVPNGDLLDFHKSYVLSPPKLDYKNLIHIVDNEKLNNIGEDKYSISSKWFSTHLHDGEVESLRRHIGNFFKHLTPSKNHNSFSNNMWTTYPTYQDSLKGKGYSKSYVPLTYKTSHNYDENKIYLAYIANIFYAVGCKYEQITEDEYALTNLLQFIWRSAIRDGKEIWIYIPSIRMRRLLKGWIDANSDFATPTTENN